MLELTRRATRVRSVPAHSTAHAVRKVRFDGRPVLKTIVTALREWPASLWPDTARNAKDDEGSWSLDAADDDVEVVESGHFVTPESHRRIAAARSQELAALHEGALEAALDAIPSAAYVVRITGDVMLANDSGRELMHGAPEKTTAELRDSLRARSEGSAFKIKELTLRNVLSPYFLAVARPRGEAALACRLQQATRAWDLTPRQAEVLALLVRGQANKDIAVALACSPKTAEVHVLSLLRKSKAESRSAIVFKFWSELG